LVGLSFRDVVTPDDVQQSEAILPRLLAGETIPIYERRFRRKNGEVFPAEVNVVLVRDQAGEPLHIQSIVRDITRRKRDEEALKDAYRQLMKLDDMKTEFINSISHELRTPITNLKLYHHLLAANPGKLQAYADTLQTQTSRLEEIVEGILFMQNVQQDLTDFDVTTVNLPRLVTDGVQRYQQISQHTGIKIVYQPGGNDLHLPGDRTLLRRALAVLLDNGVKYTPERGVVHVTIERTAGDPSSPVAVRVSNPACDLTPEDIPRLFERFYRGQNALTMGVSGAGLGLSIARQIVEQHGGELTASYDPASSRPVFVVEMRLPVEAP
jgi:signal transduction histidine kinase